jgi:choice-of-anchor B domain-containing protein
MKKYTLILFALLFIFRLNVSAQFPAQNISLLSIWDDSLNVVPEPAYGIRYTGCWGWTDTTNGREYAIIGSSRPGTYIIEVTNPTAPVLRDYIPGVGNPNKSIWHEYKTYGKYLYMVCDDGGPNTFQIADLSYLPDSVHLIHNDSSIFKRAHTIYIDGDHLYCGSVHWPGGADSSMTVFSLANPQLPQSLRSLNSDYPIISSVHDMFVRNDTVYASCGTQGLYLFKFNSNNTFTLLGNLPNPSGNYNHSSYLSDDGTVLVNCEEVPAGLPIRMVDVTDVTNPGTYTTFVSNVGATPHNPYIKNGKAIIAYYQDGIQVFNIDNPASPVRIGYFDTHPQNVSGFDSVAYAGAWGAYADLPSGVLLASDMQLGLFVLDTDTLLTSSSKTEKEKNSLSLYPNPSSENISISYRSVKEFAAVVSIIDIKGQKVFSLNKNIKQGNNHLTIDISSLSTGIYALVITGGGETIRNKKFIKN